MGYDLHWKGSQIDFAEKEYGSKVSKALKDSLEDKARQIRWKNSISELSRRFHRMFSLNGLQVAEIRFSVQSAEYRAICILVEEEKAVVYYHTVPKKGSEQERFLSLMRENSREIKEAIQNRFDLESS